MNRYICAYEVVCCFDKIFKILFNRACTRANPLNSEVCVSSRNELEIRMFSSQFNFRSQILTSLPNLEDARNWVAFTLKRKAIAFKHALLKEMELRSKAILDADLLKGARNNERYLVGERYRVIEKLDCEAAAPSERRVANYDSRRAALKFQEILLRYPRVFGQ